MLLYIVDRLRMPSYPRHAVLVAIGPDAQLPLAEARNAQLPHTARRPLAVV